MLVDSGIGERNEGTTMENSEVTAGQLVLVATPLGNLGDISRRALELLDDGRRHLLRGHAPLEHALQRARDRGQRAPARAARTQRGVDVRVKSSRRSRAARPSS